MTQLGFVRITFVAYLLGSRYLADEIERAQTDGAQAGRGLTPGEPVSEG